MPAPALGRSSTDALKQVLSLRQGTLFSAPRFPVLTLRVQNARRLSRIKFGRQTRSTDRARARDTMLIRCVMTTLSCWSEVSQVRKARSAGVSKGMSGATERDTNSIARVGPESVLSRSVDALAREVDDETVIMDLASEAYTGSGGGTHVWNALTSLALSALLMDWWSNMTSREVLMEDCINLLSALLDVGLVIPAVTAPGP